MRICGSMYSERRYGCKGKAARRPNCQPPSNVSMTFTISRGTRAFVIPNRIPLRTGIRDAEVLHLNLNEKFWVGLPSLSWRLRKVCPKMRVQRTVGECWSRPLGFSIGQRRRLLSMLALFLLVQICRRAIPNTYSMVSLMSNISRLEQMPRSGSC